ncbi:hypothetical protein PC123_g14028 [Phytophthora cactorum]|nr:hypothetical protein PC120_g22867 [Phytophthora cactorum]KAG4050734.1 hypothetical protein PC123_g14028 [Phytophthora cactorum]
MTEQLVTQRNQLAKLSHRQTIMQAKALVSNSKSHAPRVEIHWIANFGDAFA